MNVPAPILVATNWGTGGVVPLAVLGASTCVAGIFYRRTLHRPQPPGLSAILLGCAVGLALAFAAPVLFSSDVYAYAAYGEMARIGLNPYVRAPLDSADILIRAAQAQWITAFPICVYGSLFVALARALVTVLAPLGILAQLDGFRAVAAAALLLCVLLAYASYRGDATSRLRAAATLGLNPVVIWCAAEGHNDALALAVVLCGFVLARRQRLQLGAVVTALSALVKPPGVIATLALAAVNPRARAAAAAGAVVAVVFSLPLLAGVATQVAPHGTYAPQASVQAIFAPLGWIAGIGFAGTLAALLAAPGIRLLRRGYDEGWIWLALSGWALIPNPYPWYALWLVATAAMAPRSRAASVAILISFASLLRYVPDATATPTGALAVALGIAATLPLIALLPLRGWYNQQLA